MREVRGIVVRAIGAWRPEEVEFYQAFGCEGEAIKDGDCRREDLNISPGDAEAIKKNWDATLERSKGSPRQPFSGPTMRLVDLHYTGDNKMVLGLARSNYRNGCGALGFFGVAMVPVTSDGFIAMQGPISEVSATIGGGTRVPGCTPVDCDVLRHVVTEMHEEFAVNVTEEHLVTLGVIDVGVEVARPHQALIMKVKLPLTSDELKKSWEEAEDKWEGSLVFLPINRGQGRVDVEAVGGWDVINAQSRLIIAMVAGHELDVDLVEHHPRIKFG